MRRGGHEPGAQWNERRRSLHSPPMTVRGYRGPHVRLGGLLPACLVAVALVVSGCGAGGDEIPAEDAEALTTQLEELQALVDAGDCVGADAQLDEVNETVAAIEEREGVDRQIRRGLRQLADELNRLFTDDACAPEEEEPVETTEVEPVAPPPPTETTEEIEPEPTPEEDDDQSAPQGQGPDGGGPPGQDDSGTGGIGEDDE